MKLVMVGGDLQFVTDRSTYSASLVGARPAFTNFNECVAEARHLEDANAAEAKSSQ